MGIVYEAFDRSRKQAVALKTLRHLEPQALFRLKNEFRALQDLQHPNLVTLGELFEDRGQWFFTMELITGVDFLEYVTLAGAVAPEERQTAAAAPIARERLQEAATDIARAGTSPPVRQPATPLGVAVAHNFDEGRLRRALIGLAHGVNALHQSGMVHRDIKPSNVLVTSDGRVVLLDFGLVAETTTVDPSSESQVVGTAAYMAPEQAAAKRAGPAADWHSVGIVLYEALTGRLPYTGTSIEILMDKQRHDPPPPRAHDPSVPPDLDELCVDLLRFDPAARPTGPEVLRRLGAGDSIEPQRISTSHGSGTQPFVGRGQELEILADAFDATGKGQPVTVFLYGESGVGKSALVRQLTRRLEAQRADLVRLSGRCFERESMLYKAFDGVIDELSQYMRRLPDREVGTLLPRNAALLPRVFPVLARVEIIAQAPRPRQAVKDPRELRARVFAALREMLGRIADRHPLVITIDDLQWADADSAHLLAELLRPPDAPPILLLVTSRQAREPPPPIPGDVRRLAIEALPPDSARQLARILLRRAALGREVSAAEIAVDARGNPLFIDQLVRHAATVPGPDRPRTRLADVIRDRVNELDTPARFVLELVCVAERPLYQSAIRHAARMERAEFARHVALLRVANLVRGRRDGEFETIEPYHDRVREAVMLPLDDEPRRKRHARLARALDDAGATRLHPQLVLRHFEAAGDLTKATACAMEAAQRAGQALAFDRAAEFYQRALKLVDPKSPRAREIRMALGDALVNAGHGAEAADVFLDAGADAEPRVRIECQRRAAEQLLTTGRVARGLEVLSQLMAELGDELPPTPREALRQLVWSRIKLRLRGMGWTERLPEEITDRELVRLDVYKTASHGLAMVDAVRSADFQSRGLLLALRTGERTRVGLFLATEAIHLASQGAGKVRRAQALLDEARRIAQVGGNHYLLTWTVLARGFLRYFENRFSLARRAAVRGRAEDPRRGHRHGVGAGELPAVSHVGAAPDRRAGRVAPLLRRLHRGRRRARRPLQRHHHAAIEQHRLVGRRPAGGGRDVHRQGRVDRARRQLPPAALVADRGARRAGALPRRHRPRRRGPGAAVQRVRGVAAHAPAARADPLRLVARAHRAGRRQHRWPDPGNPRRAQAGAGGNQPGAGLRPPAPRRCRRPAASTRRRADRAAPGHRAVRGARPAALRQHRAPSRGRADRRTRRRDGDRAGGRLLRAGRRRQPRASCRDVCSWIPQRA